MIETNNQRPHLPSKTAAALKDLMDTHTYTLWSIQSIQRILKYV